MAITRTRSVAHIQLYHRDSEWRVDVVYNEVFEDTEDAQLPFTSDRKVVLKRYTESTDENGNKVQSVTDISGEDAAVQAVCNALWTD
jgi:hypothetical protein